MHQSEDHHMCPRCESEIAGAPWFIADKYSRKVEMLCPDCAIAVLEERAKLRERQVKKLSEN